MSRPRQHTIGGEQVSAALVSQRTVKDHQLEEFRLNRPVQVYVAERDANALIRPMFGAERPYNPTLADVDAFLRNWIKQVRWVSPDLVRMGADITDAYAALD